jgi:hypothetical protein
VIWGLVGESVKENGTVEHIEQLLHAAKDHGYDVFVSPHYYYPTDKGWKFGGTVEKMMDEIGMFGRPGALTTEGFEGSGADWLEQYKPLIDDGKTIVVNPTARRATTCRCSYESAASRRCCWPGCRSPPADRRGATDRLSRRAAALRWRRPA